jgi:hypothetical protein
MNKSAGGTPFLRPENTKTAFSSKESQPRGAQVGGRSRLLYRDRQGAFRRRWRDAARNRLGRVLLASPSTPPPPSSLPAPARSSVLEAAEEGDRALDPVAFGDLARHLRRITPSGCAARAWRTEKYSGGHDVRRGSGVDLGGGGSPPTRAQSWSSVRWSRGCLRSKDVLNNRNSHQS